MTAAVTTRPAWVKRHATPADENGVVYIWLKSFAHSRYGRQCGAAVDGTPAEWDYWADHRIIVMRLLREAETTILCDPDDANVIYAFACTSGNVVHYVAAKRRFCKDFGAEMFRALLGPLLQQPAIYTHQLMEFARDGIREKLPLPEQWRYDPYWLARTAHPAVAA